MQTLNAFLIGFKADNFLKSLRFLPKIMASIFMLLALLLLNNQTVSAQDTLPEFGDEPTVRLHSPTRATIYSAVLPGLGQVYNKKYWKVPIVVSTMGAAGYMIGYNRSIYREFKESYIAEIDSDSTTVSAFGPLYTTSYLETETERFRRYMEISYIAFIALYALQIVDASVDAHLFTFDVGPDLSFNLQPTLLQPRGSARPITGLSLSLKL